MTPYQAGLGAFIDLDKEGFVGRAALIDADRQTLLYGLKCATVSPPWNSQVLDGDQIVGRVTAGAWSPFLNCGIAYVRFNQPGAWAGRTLSLKLEQTTPCQIVELPFYDPEKRIPRGLDKSVP
jgi:aminomethyltransferase